MDNDMVKFVVTFVNVLILLGLPGWLIAHIRCVSKKIRWSYDWWMQIIISLSYIMAICAEIPALWSRYIAYYELKLPLPDSLYILSTWDRWSHLVFYCFYYLLTWSITYKRIPEAVKNTLA